MRQATIIRIDPERRTIAAMKLRAGKDATPRLKQLTRAVGVQGREIMEVDDKPLMVVAGVDVDEAAARWQLRGTDDTAGIGILAGRSRIGSVLTDVPVDVAWVRERIVWLPGEDPVARAARAEELVPMLNAEVRAAIDSVIILPGGEMWVDAEHAAPARDSMISLGLGDERTDGQRLTKLGEAVYDLVMAR